MINIPENRQPATNTPLRLPLLSSSLVCHGFFGRDGGISPPPWDSLNVGFHLGDQNENVLKNRARITKTLGLDHLVGVKQVHGSKVLSISSTPPPVAEEAEGYDALITNVAGLGLLVQQADCQAIVLFDPLRRAVGIAHAGWRGCVANIIGRTVTAMATAFASRPTDLLAGISPSLGPCCAEFIHFRTELPRTFHDYQVRPNYFDFWAISREQLRDAGVRSDHIAITGVCTKCSADFFSFRRDNRTGRGASVIGISRNGQA